MKKILYVLFANMGDVCCGTPAYLALRKKFPDHVIEWMTLKKHAQLVPGPAVTVADEGKYGKYPHAIAGYDQVYCVQPMWYHEEWSWSKLHAIDLIAKWCDVTLEDREIKIPIPSDVDAYISSLPLPDRFATVCSSMPKSSKDVLTPHLQSICDALRKSGLHVVTVGGPEGIPLKGSLPMHGALSPIESTALIAKSSVYVGPDSGASWLACSAKKPRKVMVLDSDRLKSGVVGFQGYQGDPNVTDVMVQEGGDAIIEKVVLAAKEALSIL